MSKKNIVKKVRVKSKKKKIERWTEQKVDIREHRDKLRDMHSSRISPVGWMLALAGMAALLTLLNNPF